MIIMKEIISIIRNFPRHCKTAVQSIWRNGVMSISSIFAVMITLTLIGVISIIALNVQDMTVSIEDSLTIYVKLERNISDEEALAVGDEIANIEGVVSYTYSTKDEELETLIAYYQEDDGTSIFDNYRGDANPCSAAYRVEVEDATNLEEVTSAIQEIYNVNNANYGGSSTSTLVSALETVRNAGSVVVVALVIVAFMMISNTIKMAITARENEIQIMRMVGASNWYIRIPFMLEGLLIGLIGSIIPIVIIYLGYNALYDSLGGIFMAELLVLKAPQSFLLYFSLFLALVGSIVGLVGSFFSVRRFLKF